MAEPDPLTSFQPPPRRLQPRRGSTTLWAGGILLLVGLYFLLRNLGYLSWLGWDIVWPSVLILIGVFLVVRRWR
jgi:Domain of unknown function (DUF5668)